MHKPPLLLFIDFEASSLLPGTYPIEVGWIGDGVIGESHLIHPSAFPWGDWSYESEAIHGISQDTLRRDGKPAEAVGRRLLEVLHGRQAVVGSTSLDRMWLELLLETVGEDPPALLSEPAALLQTATDILGDQTAARKAVTLAQEARLDDIVHHRALPDAEDAYRLYRTLIAIAERMKAARG